MAVGGSFEFGFDLLEFIPATINQAHIAVILLRRSFAMVDIIPKIVKPLSESQFMDDLTILVIILARILQHPNQHFHKYSQS